MVSSGSGTGAGSVVALPTSISGVGGAGAGSVAAGPTTSDGQGVIHDLVQLLNAGQYE